MKTMIPVGITSLVPALFLTALSTAGMFIADPLRAGEIFVDDFGSGKLEGRQAERGQWEFQDGIASCVADPDLYKKFKNHGPIIKWPREFSDAAIQFEMKANDCQRVVFTLNGDGHIFRVTLADESPDAPAGTSKVPTRIIAWATKSSKQNKGDTIKPKSMPDLPSVNEKWVQVKLNVIGKRAILSIGDFQTEIDHAALARAKNMVMLTFAHGELSVRNLRIQTSVNAVAKPTPLGNR